MSHSARGGPGKIRTATYDIPHTTYYPGRERIEINGTFRFAQWLERLFVAPLLLYRRARYGYAFRRIPFSQPKCAKVDPADYHRLREYEWFTMKETHTFYAVRRKRIGTSPKHTIVRMHRQLINPRNDRLVDHINRDGVDNRTANIREATHAQNMANRKRFRSKTSSIYKGIFFRRGTRRPTWQANIRANGKNIYLGCFTDEIDAAKAYDEAAKKYHGEFACLNFPDPQKRTPLMLSIFRVWLSSLIRLIKPHRHPEPPLPHRSAACRQCPKRTDRKISRPAICTCLAVQNTTVSHTRVAGVSPARIAGFQPAPCHPAPKITSQAKHVPQFIAGFPCPPAWRVLHPAPGRGDTRPAGASNPEDTPPPAEHGVNSRPAPRPKKPLKAPITTIWGHFSALKKVAPRHFRFAPAPWPAPVRSLNNPSRTQRHHPIRPP